MLRYVLILLSLLLTACGESKDVWIEGWQQTSPLKISRAGAAVVAADDHIYVIGGVDGRVFLNTVEYARINRDGSLGDWQTASTMNEPRGFTAAVVYQGSIYAIGGGNGMNGQNLLRTVERARLLPDGKLGPWTREPEVMVLPRRCSKVVVEGNRIYSFGGFGGVLLDSVERAEFNADGSIGAWRLEDKAMTVPRYTSGVNWVDGKTIVTGGHHASAGGGITSVEWSPMSAAGHQGWRQTSALQADRFELTTVDHKNHVYVMGGISAVDYLDTIEVAAVTGNGITPWQFTTSLSSPRASFGAVVYRDYLYVIGGTNLEGYFNSVEYARIDNRQRLGYWGTQQEKSAYQQKLQEQKAKITHLPNSGVVWEIIQTSGYTYVHVLSPELGELWLAGNKLESLQVNDTVEFSSGVRMSNYYSKTLDRSFPTVLFVGALRKVE